MYVVVKLFYPIGEIIVLIHFGLLFLDSTFVQPDEDLKYFNQSHRSLIESFTVKGFEHSKSRIWTFGICFSKGPASLARSKKVPSSTQK